MKKALAFILASFVFASVFFKSIHAKASDYAIPNSGWLPVIYDIFYSLVNGNEINVAELAGELTGINAVIDKYNELRTGNYDSPFASAINMSYYTYLASMYEGDIYDFAAQYSLYLKDGTYPVLGRYSKDRVARWNQYNTQFNDIYLDYFVTDSGTPDVYPDLNYETYIDIINGSGFFWKNYSFLNYRNVAFIPYQPFSSYSYINTSNGNFMYDSVTTRTLNFSDIFTVNIVSNDNITYSINKSIDCIIIGQVENISNGYLYQSGIKNNELDYPNVQFTDVYNATATLSYSGTLQGCFEYLSQKVRNVNIYVNGVAWSLVGTIDNPDIISPPDVIRNDNGLIDSQDVFVPDQELAFDLIGLINLLEDALQNQDTITFDDIVNDGNILKNPDGTALDDARTHILQSTIQRVIADEYERDDPEPIPTTTPPPYPTFPEVNWRKNPIPEPLPTGFDTSNGNPADAFSGASTLAQIVDATNRGLPSELVYTFWGIVFGMIVLGIIKVLHK